MWPCLLIGRVPHHTSHSSPQTDPALWGAESGLLLWAKLHRKENLVLPIAQNPVPQYRTCELTGLTLESSQGTWALRECWLCWGHHLLALALLPNLLEGCDVAAGLQHKRIRQKERGSLEMIMGPLPRAIAFAWLTWLTGRHLWLQWQSDLGAVFWWDLAHSLQSTCHLLWEYFL